MIRVNDFISLGSIDIGFQVDEEKTINVSAVNYSSLMHSNMLMYQF